MGKIKSYLWIWVLLLAFVGCNRQDEPLPVHGDPVFYLKGTFGDDLIEINAGLDGVILNAFEIQDENGEQWYLGRFERIGDDPLSLDLSFRDIRGISDDPIDPLTTLNQGSFQVNDLDTNDFYSVQFVADPFPSERALVSISWSFGDGTSSTEMSPTHIYPAGDSKYTVCATYTYKTGCERQLCYDINPSLPGMVDIQLNTQTPGVVLGFAITKGFVPVDFRWDFEPGFSEQGPEIAYTPSSGKNVETICLTAFDGEGNEYNICRDVIFEPQNACTANFDFASMNVREISHGDFGERVCVADLSIGGQSWKAADGSGQIRILESLTYERNALGLPTRKLSIQGKIDLINSLDEVRSLNISEAVIAVAYPE